MKRVVKIFLGIVVFLLATNGALAQDAQKRTNEAQVVFSVNLDCHNCEQKVVKNIPFERGVRDMTTNLEKQLVTIKYQTNRTDKAKLKAAIEKLGFTCEEVTPNAQKK